MTSEPKTLPRGLFLLTLVLYLGLGLVIARIYLASHNSLRNNGNWIATKATLARGVMGANSFLFSLQPLAGGSLNLSAWHGYQEVVLEREVDPQSVEFDLFLASGSYLNFLFNLTESGFSGIRLSNDPRFPGMVFSATPEGEFTHRDPLTRPKRIKPGRWHNLRVELTDEGFSVLLNDREVKTYRGGGVQGRQRIGFRGGRNLASVDNIRVQQRDDSTFRETFSQPRDWPLVNARSVGGVVLLATLLFLLLRRLLPVGDTHLLLYFFMFGAVLLVLGGLLLAFTSYEKRFYPDEGEKLRREEAYWKKSRAEEIFGRIAEQYQPEPPPRTHRLVFLGASQTHGSGAAKESETLVRTTERLLGARSGETSFECIDTAVHGHKIADMARDFTERWIAWKPSTVIVNASNNDIGYGVRQFEGWLDGLVETSRRAGIDVVLIMEPNSTEREATSLRHFHAAMARVAEKHDVPVIDMHAHLAGRYDDGFLWWDWIHLTSFGQRLFAERLVEELDRLGLAAG